MSTALRPLRLNSNSKGHEMTDPVPAYLRFLITWADSLTAEEHQQDKLADAVAKGHVAIADSGKVTVTPAGEEWVATNLHPAHRAYEIAIVLGENMGGVFDMLQKGASRAEVARRFDQPGLRLVEADVDAALTTWSASGRHLDAVFSDGRTGREWLAALPNSR